jgi:hypothetical protein
LLGLVAFRSGDTHSQRSRQFATQLSTRGHATIVFYLKQHLKQADSVAMKKKVALGLGLAKEEQDYGYTQRRRRRPPPPVDTSGLDTPEGLELAHSKVIFTWREQESYEEAQKVYPFVRNMVVPDIAFQLGPFAPIRKRPKKLVDVLVFLRADLESKVKSIRNEDYM